MNTVNLIGRMTNNIEVKNVGDSKVGRFSVAVKREFSKDKTDFFECEVWGKSVDYIEKYLGKGQLVGLSGRLQQDTWERDGKRNQAVRVIINNIQGLTFKDSNVQETKAEQKSFDEFEIDPAEIPF